jgi:hypothetical protein
MCDYGQGKPVTFIQATVEAMSAEERANRLQEIERCVLLARQAQDALPPTVEAIIRAEVTE